MMAVLALVANIGFAQTTTLWQEDFSSYKADAVPNGGAYNYACEGSGTKVYAENLAGGDAPELLVSKKRRLFFCYRFSQWRFRTIDIDLQDK